MAHDVNPKRAAAKGRYFVVDAAYFRKQASEAVATFFAPFSGVVKAARGEQPKAGFAPVDKQERVARKGILKKRYGLRKKKGFAVASRRHDRDSKAGC